MITAIIISVCVIGLGIGGYFIFKNNKKSNEPTTPDTPKPVEPTGEVEPVNPIEPTGQTGEPYIPDEPIIPVEPIKCSSETHRLYGIKISSKPTNERILVGTYDIDEKCECKWSLVKASEGEDFLNDFVFENGEIKAVIVKANIGEERTTRYITKHTGKGGDKEDYFDVTQESGYDEEFESYLNAFKKYVSIKRWSDLYKYLYETYLECKSQFYNNKSINDLPQLYVEINFPNVYDYFGNDGNPDNGFKTMTAWTIALNLIELMPLKRTGILKIAYELGGYNKYSNIYGYKFKADPNIARLVGSSIYATLRGKKLPDIEKFRSEVGGSKYSKTLAKLGDDKRENVSETDFFIDFREFMPTAPGPYAPSYTTRPDNTYPNEKKESNKNLSMDLTIHQMIVENYNLNNPKYFQRTVQAIADKEGDVQHLFGDNITYKSYSFHPVFGLDTIGIRLSPDGDLAKLVKDAQYAGSSSRGILQSSKVDPKQYGRLRPGCSWEKEATKHSTTDDRYNVLCNFDIEDNDGCETGYYNKSGKWVYPSQINSEKEFCEYFKKQLYANSFPSGHSSGIWSAAMTLMEIMPNRADKIMKAANEFAINRTVSRFHWTSDTINGRVVGSAQNAVSHASSDYDELLVKAKQEI